MRRWSFKQSRKIAASAFLFLVLLQGQALACGVCFSPEQNLKIRNAYLMATTIMLLVLMAVMGGLFMMFRHYRRQTAGPKA